MARVPLSQASDLLRTAGKNLLEQGVWRMGNRRHTWQHRARDRDLVFCHTMKQPQNPGKAMAEPECHCLLVLKGAARLTEPWPRPASRRSLCLFHRECRSVTVFPHHPFPIPESSTPCIYTFWDHASPTVCRGAGGRGGRSLESTERERDPSRNTPRSDFTRITWCT